MKADARFPAQTTPAEPLPTADRQADVRLMLEAVAVWVERRGLPDAAARAAHLRAVLTPDLIWRLWETNPQALPGQAIQSLLGQAALVLAKTHKTGLRNGAI